MKIYFKENDNFWCLVGKKIILGDTRIICFYEFIKKTTKRFERSCNNKVIKKCDIKTLTEIIIEKVDSNDWKSWLKQKKMV